MKAIELYKFITENNIEWHYRDNEGREQFKYSCTHNPNNPFDNCELRCDGCGNVDKLNVHHKRYIKGKEPWEYEDKDLQILCKSCHETYHKNKNDLNDFFSKSRLAYSYEFKTIMGICKSLCGMDTNDIGSIKMYCEEIKNSKTSF